MRERPNQTRQPDTDNRGPTLHLTVLGGEPRALGFIERATILKVLCACVLGSILVAGLWPFHAPMNDVGWLNSGNGLRFGDFGSIVSAGTFKTRADTSCSIEIWVEPKQANYAGTILAFYWPETGVVSFELSQSLGDLLLQRTKPDEVHHARRSKVYVGDLFGQAKPIFITISSGPAGTAVYADGSLVKKSSSFIFSGRDLTGQLVIGNAPATTDSWSGQLKGLALYDRELKPSEVSQHYTNWAKREQADLAKSEGTVALYTFGEGNGNIAHSQRDSATDLLIPERFFVLHAQFLEPFWEEFSGGWGYWRNIGINIAGFIPLGFFFCAYFSLVRGAERSAAVTIALGFAVSLTIEVLQGFLPTRNSGTTDLITNTLGTAIGVMVNKNRTVQLVCARLAVYAKKSNIPVAAETGVHATSPQGAHKYKEMYTI